MNEEFSIHHRTDLTPCEIRIVDAARNRFLRFGYAKTSMREIAADCHMSAANLYRFYPGKLAIAAAVVDKDRRNMMAACDVAIGNASTNAISQLSSLFLTIIDLTKRQIREEPLLFELGLIVAREEPGARQALLDESKRRIAAILDASRPRDSVDLETEASVIHLASAPFVLPWMLANQPFGEIRSKVPQVIACLVNGLPSSAAARSTAS